MAYEEKVVNVPRNPVIIIGLITYVGINFLAVATVKTPIINDPNILHIKIS